MILAKETLVLYDWFGEETALKLIKQSGFDGVDYSFYHIAPEKNMLGNDYLNRA